MVPGRVLSSLFMTQSFVFPFLSFPSIKDSPSVQTLVDQLSIEFKDAVEDLKQKSAY